MREPVRAAATQSGSAEPAGCSPRGASPSRVSVAQRLHALGGAISLAGAPFVTPARHTWSVAPLKGRDAAEMICPEPHPGDIVLAGADHPPLGIQQRSIH